MILVLLPGCLKLSVSLVLSSNSFLTLSLTVDWKVVVVNSHLLLSCHKNSDSLLYNIKPHCHLGSLLFASSLRFLLLLSFGILLSTIFQVRPRPCVSWETRDSEKVKIPLISLSYEPTNHKTPLTMTLSLKPLLNPFSSSSSLCILVL